MNPVDFFISHATVDKDWATWVAWQLEDVGFSTAVQAWDFPPGSHFVYEMQKHASTAHRTIALLSDDYLQRAFTHAEWAAAFAQDPLGVDRRLLPIRIRRCSPSGLLHDLVYLDLLDLSENEARSKLISMVEMLDGDSHETRRSKPIHAPPFPRTAPDGSHAETETARRARSTFVHAALRAGGMLELRDAILPYHVSDLATEPGTGAERPVFVFLWFPHAQYLAGSTLMRFTPCVAICATDFGKVANSFVTSLGDHVNAVLTYNPSALRPHEKVAAIRAAGSALDTSFVAAIAVPEIMLGVGRSQPSVAYQSMCDLLLLPVAELHRKRGIGRIGICLAPAGKATTNILKCAKRIGGSVFSRRARPAIVIAEDDLSGRALAAVSRVVAWAVGRYYNNAERRWLAELEKSVDIELK